MTLTQCIIFSFLQSNGEVKLIKAHYEHAGGELKKSFNREKLAFKLDSLRDILTIKVRCGRPTESGRENQHD